MVRYKFFVVPQADVIDSVLVCKLASDVYEHHEHVDPFVTASKGCIFIETTEYDNTIKALSSLDYIKQYGVLED